MTEKNYTETIPKQETGIPIDTESSLELDTEQHATQRFELAKHRLLHVNQWHEVANRFSAHFQLMDEHGRPLEGEARQGYYFRIQIPGSENKGGEGFDWVIIEDVEYFNTDQIESVAIRVRPTSCPQNDKDSIDHFYSKDSTSTFTVTREGNKLTAAIYDRNTKPNAEGHNILHKIRDAIVGAVGIAAMSKIQWKNLAVGLLEEEKAW